MYLNNITKRLNNVKYKFVLYNFYVLVFLQSALIQYILEKRIRDKSRQRFSIHVLRFFFPSVNSEASPEVTSS